MSAGVCGKRVGFEEIFGSASSPRSAAKRSRCSSYGSPIRSSDFTSGSEETFSALLQMFPGLSPELVDSVLKNHNNKIEDAIESLRALSFADVSSNNGLQSHDSTMIGNCGTSPGGQMPEQVEGLEGTNSTLDPENITDGSKWVDMFVQEMMNSRDLDDARGRAARILEAFERSVISHSRGSVERENASLKEHLQTLLRDNQILKRAVSIQHERNSEQEVITREVEHLKHVICQYQEQVRTLEMSNYTLKLHLQRAQESSSIPGQFHPDIF